VMVPCRRRKCQATPWASRATGNNLFIYVEVRSTSFSNFLSFLFFILGLARMDDDRSVLLVSHNSHSHTHTHVQHLYWYMKRTTKVITIGIITIGRVEPNINMEHWCFCSTYLIPRNRRALGGDMHRFPLGCLKPNMGR
jgi:hypothetical protein